MFRKMNHKDQYVRDLLVENYDKYYRIAYSYCFQESDALDIVQEAAVKAINSSKSLKEIKYADTWICRIVINTAYTYLKQRQKTVLEMPEEQQIYEENYESLLLKELLGTLEEPDKSIVLLRFFEDYQLDEIAASLELNISTVKTKLYRGLKKLRAALEEKE